METEIVNPQQVGNKHVCPQCQQLFTLKSSLTRHLKQNVCTKPKLTVKGLVDTLKANNDAMAKLTASNDLIVNNQNHLMKMMEGINATQTPFVYNHNHNQNQNLNIMCLGSKDNLLDILSASEGLPLALTFLKDCALARLAGDCRILQKAYQLETQQAAIKYVNKTKNKYVYYDERRRRTVEDNAKVMAKKLADIVQRSYLKGMECFKTGLSGQIKDNQLTVNSPNINKMPELDPYDLHLWNEHVHELNDEKYQKKLLNSLKIPVEPPRE